MEISRRTLGKDHPRHSERRINNQGSVLLMNQGKLAEAEPYFCARLWRKSAAASWVPSIKDTLVSINSLAVCSLWNQGKLDGS